MVPILRHPAAFDLTRRADRMRGILDDFQIVPARDRADAIHVAGMAGEVHRHQSP